MHQVSYFLEDGATAGRGGLLAGDGLGLLSSSSSELDSSSESLGGNMPAVAGYSASAKCVRQSWLGFAHEAD